MAPRTSHAIDFGTIRIQGRARSVGEKEIARIEANLWLHLPAGYREFMGRFGEGLYRKWIRVYPPHRIESDLGDWRRRITRDWFWDKGKRVLPRERAVECVIIADTIEGDELVFHPCRPDRLFVLPRNSEQIFEAGADLREALDWMSSSGKIARAGDPVFESVKIDHATSPSRDGAPLDALVSGGRAWAKGRSARKEAARELRDSIPKGAKATFAFEAIVLEGEFPLEAGYLAEWTVSNAKGKRLGLYRGSVMEEGALASYEPFEDEPFEVPKMPRSPRKR